MNPSQIHIVRFWSRVDKSAGSDGCWLWTKKVDKDGYGRFAFGPAGWQTHARAHRLAHFLATGELPEVVMHKCDNPPCCNPSHLEGGTNLKNQQDAAAKGRKPRGLENPAAKLSVENLTEMMRLANKHVPNTVIAKMFGVSYGLVSRVKNGHYESTLAEKAREQFS